MDISTYMPTGLKSLKHIAISLLLMLAVFIPAANAEVTTVVNAHGMNVTGTPVDVLFSPTDGVLYVEKGPPVPVREIAGQVPSPNWPKNYLFGWENSHLE